MAILRKGTPGIDLDQVEMEGSDRGFVVGLSLMGGHSRRIFHEHHSTAHAFSDSSIYIRDLSCDYKADLGGPFEFMLFEMSAAALASFSEHASVPSVRSLSPRTAVEDKVLANLGRALLPALENPALASPLYIEHLSAAIGTHLVQWYGGQPVTVVQRRLKLSPAHERLAKELLSENLGGEVSIADVAHACNLSRGHFTRMFRETTGVTPHQWLIGERLARACDLLRRSELNLAEVAIACGFSDQSHFTRFFSRIKGVSPGSWRRSSS
ncbi:AraC family transcriptional regulator [Neorhizobium sp. JUb45]|uniref:AraC family transcriptional regulator n=1 Tax=unclassified Neorhizobium TaxID=2629175 RepID=UPI001FDF99CE|nr:AraC family transcriptional regulator [Neorhizobium sp. JUb45]